MTRMSSGLKRDIAITLAGTVLLLAGFPATAVDWNAREQNWYLQTVATNGSGNQDDRSGVIGHIPGGAAGYDEHDIPAFSSVSGAPVAVIFHQGEAWGEHAGEYLSDYRAPGKTRQVWDFTVTTSNPDDTVTLSWDGLHVITRKKGGAGFDTRLDPLNRGLRTLRLIDLSLGEVVTRAAESNGVLSTYTFQMGGVNERSFRWVTGVPTPQELTANAPAPMTAVAPRTAASALRSVSAPMVKPVSGFPEPPPLDTPASEGVTK